jgi:hypothetical protein
LFEETTHGRTDDGDFAARGFGLDFGENFVAGRKKVVEIVIDVGLRDVSMVAPTSGIRCGGQENPQCSSRMLIDKSETER